LLSEGRSQMTPKIGTICLNRPWPIVHRESGIGKALRIQLQRYGIEQRHLPRYPAFTNELIKRHYGLRSLFAVVDRLQLPLKHLLGDVFWNFTERDETPGPSWRPVCANDVLPPACYPDLALLKQIPFLETASSHAGPAPFSRWFFRLFLRRGDYSPS